MDLKMIQPKPITFGPHEPISILTTEQIGIGEIEQVLVKRLPLTITDSPYDTVQVAVTLDGLETRHRDKNRPQRLNAFSDD